MWPPLAKPSINSLPSAVAAEFSPDKCLYRTPLSGSRDWRLLFIFTER
jgi:hypothetical protein